MEIYLDNTYLTVKNVYSVMIRRDDDVKTTYTGYLWWRKKHVTTTERWLINLDYKGVDDRRYTYTASHGDYAIIKKEFDNLTQQLKTFNSQWADRALEDAIMGGGTK